MTRYSPAEMEIRLAAVKPIVEAAYAIRGIVLGEEKIAVYAEHWEAAFGRVATAQLRDLYRVGLEKQCKTAEEFLMRWEMKVEAEIRAAEHRKLMRELPQLPSADRACATSPEFIAQLKARVAADRQQSQAKAR